MKLSERRKMLREQFRNRRPVFGGWVSYAHPSITETFAMAGFDFIAIDMEHGTISVEQAQRIIAAAQAEGSLCFPRPVSHSNDWIKPLLDSGADGVLVQMVETPEQVRNLIDLVKYAPVGRRSFGVNRAQDYGFTFEDYVQNWNDESCLLLQIESATAVDTIDEILAFDEVDGVMVGPYDMSGSLGVPGQTTHPKVLEATKRVVEACKRAGKSCGTQLADVTPSAVDGLFAQGYTFAFLGSDLFVLWKWAEHMQRIIAAHRKRA